MSAAQRLRYLIPCIVTQTLDVSTFTCANVGANTVTMTVTDVAGLTDVSSSTVTVLDTISPQITCPGDQIEVVDASCELSLPDYTGSAIIVENCGGSVIVQTPAAGTLLSGHGTTQIVQLKVTDASGNADSCTFTVTLEDTTDPIAISQDTTVYLGAGGTVTIDSSFVDDGSSDNCGIVTQTLDVSDLHLRRCRSQYGYNDCYRCSWSYRCEQLYGYGT